MLARAFRTRDLSSYSAASLVLTYVGNVVYSAYVFSLPRGPIWVMHTFYLTTGVLMLTWYRRFGAGGRRPDRTGSAVREDCVRPAAMENSSAAAAVSPARAISAVVRPPTALRVKAT